MTKWKDIISKIILKICSCTHNLDLSTKPRLCLKIDVGCEEFPTQALQHNEQCHNQRLGFHIE